MIIYRCGDLMEFLNKVVLITGASRGIGRQIAIDFAKAGAIVIANYNRSEKDAIELSKMYSNIDIIKADISSEEEVKAMIDTIIYKYKHIDILINNAGICNDSLIEDKTKNSFMKILEVNLVGMFLVCKYASKYINKDGSIINISSTNAIDTNYIYSLDYDASKAGVISLSSNLAKAYAPIRVNTIAPGWIDTDMNINLDNEDRDRECQNIILNRFGKVEEVSNVCMFLASSKASYINNAVIRVDGGKK